MSLKKSSQIKRVSTPRSIVLGLWSLTAAIALASCSQPATQITTLEVGETPAPQPSDTAQANLVRFGVLVIDNAVSVRQRYAPLLAYLSEATGHPFELVLLTQESQFSSVAAKKIDFVATNSLAAVQLQRLYGAEFLATHSRPQTGTQFSGSIIVREDSNIQTLKDLRGRRVACVNFQTAAAGCVFQIQHLLNEGIDPFTDFEQFIENQSQDNIVLAVLNRTLDAGFVRTGQLEKMVSQQLLANDDDIRVLAPVKDDFYYAHTTALYPEWPVAALQHADPALVSQVKTALMEIESQHPALTAAKLDGFVSATDYSAIDRMIERLRLKSWEIK
ncbi:MAG: phosphate/phosphite/phosphonate ABC transporter substrate-binding protein [Leptolyngbyaceae cyanobacterium]